LNEETMSGYLFCRTARVYLHPSDCAGPYQRLAAAVLSHAIREARQSRTACARMRRWSRTPTATMWFDWLGITAERFERHLPDWSERALLSAVRRRRESVEPARSQSETGPQTVDGTGAPFQSGTA
jgi:hypothetical protein